MKLELDETFHDLIESEDTPYIKKLSTQQIIEKLK